MWVSHEHDLARETAPRTASPNDSNPSASDGNPFKDVEVAQYGLGCFERWVAGEGDTLALRKPGQETAQT